MFHLLNSFFHDLDELKRYFLYLNSIDVSADEAPKSEYSSIKKKFEYSIAIINLYGIFERFTEELIETYLLTLTEIVEEFKKLPSKIQENHVGFSAKLIQDLNLPKFSRLTTEDAIIENLYSCINKEKYSLNTPAFINHKANIKHQTISDLSREVGINLKLLKHDKDFKDHLSPKFGDSNLERINEETLFFPLTDLAQRRNEVSHGVRDIELLSYSFIEEKIEFVRFYGKALFNVYMNELSKIKIQNKTLTELEVLNVIDGRIICIELENPKIRKNDVILFKTSNSFHSRRIVNIEINGEKLDFIESNEKLKIGIELANGYPRLKKSYRYFLS